MQVERRNGDRFRARRPNEHRAELPQQRTRRPLFTKRKNQPHRRSIVPAAFEKPPAQVAHESDRDLIVEMEAVDGDHHRLGDPARRERDFRRSTIPALGLGQLASPGRASPSKSVEELSPSRPRLGSLSPRMVLEGSQNAARHGRLAVESDFEVARHARRLRDDLEPPQEMRNSDAGGTDDEHDVRARIERVGFPRFFRVGSEHTSLECLDLGIASDRPIGGDRTNRGACGTIATTNPRQRVCECAGVFEPRAGIESQTLEDDAIEHVVVSAGVGRGRTWGGIPTNGIRRSRRRTVCAPLQRSRRATGQQPIERHADCVDVGPRAECALSKVFGGHVRQRPVMGSVGIRHGTVPMQSEVDEHDTTALSVSGRENVARLDVEVKDPRLVESGHGEREIEGDRKPLVGRRCRVRSTDRLTVDELAREERTRIDESEVEGSRHAGVIDSGEQRELPPKSIERRTRMGRRRWRVLRVLEIRRSKELQRDVSLGHAIEREEHTPVRAAAELAATLETSAQIRILRSVYETPP